MQSTILILMKFKEHQVMLEISSNQHLLIKLDNKFKSDKIKFIHISKIIKQCTITLKLLTKIKLISKKSKDKKLNNNKKIIQKLIILIFKSKEKIKIYTISKSNPLLPLINNKINKTIKVKDTLETIVITPKALEAHKKASLLQKTCLESHTHFKISQKKSPLLLNPSLINFNPLFHAYGHFTNF